MGEQDKRCRGIGRAAWGYFFVFFSLKLGSLELLPDFAGHLLFLGAIALLTEEERTLALLRPISILLAALSGLEWAAALLGQSPEGLWQLPEMVGSLLFLYFNFQFLTDLARIAARRQPPDSACDQTLLRCRTTMTLIQTALILARLLFRRIDFARSELLRLVCFVLLALTELCVGVYMMAALFRLRRSLRPGESPA